LLTGCVREPGIAAGHLDILMAQELLETFQAHPGVEQLGGERVAETMHGVAFLFETGLLNIFYEPAPSGTVTDGLIVPAVKDKLLVLIPFPKPAF